MKLKRSIFGIFAFILILSTLSSCGISFFENPADNIHTGPIELGFIDDSAINPPVGPREMTIACRFEKSCFSSDEDVKVQLSYGGIDEAYRENVPEDNEIEIEMRVGYHGGESESIVLKRLTVAEIQKKATIENGVWQFGISEEFSIPKELLLCEKNGYYLSFLINDVNVEDNDDSYEYHPYYYGNSVRVYYHLEDTVIYFSPSYNPDKHELK